MARKLPLTLSTGPVAGLILAVAVLLLPIATAGPTSPTAAVADGGQPTPGVWIVTEHERYENDDLDVTGNILIQDGGTLELVASTLVMNATPPAEPVIQVEAGGRLILNGSSERATLIKDGPLDDERSGFFPDLDFHYQIRIENGGIMQGRHCNITDSGINSHVRADTPEPAGEPGSRGLSVFGGTLSLANCVIYDSHDGFYARNATIQLDYLRNVLGPRYQDFVYAVNFMIEGGDVEIRNSVFTYHAGLEGIQGLIIENTTWIAPSTDRAQGGFIGFTDTIGRLDQLTIHGQSSALSAAGNSQLEVRNATLSAGQRGVDILPGAANQRREIVLDTVLIHDMVPPPGFGAISVRGGFSSAKLVAMNTTISDIQGDHLLMWANQEAVLRNVTFDKHRVDIADGAILRTEGLLRAYASDARDGTPLGGVRVIAGPTTVQDPLSGITGADGAVILWVPAEEYDATAAGRWVPVYPEGWPVTLSYRGSTLHHTVGATPHDARLGLVWDPDGGLRLAGQDNGRDAPMPASWAAAGLVVAALVWPRRARVPE